MYFGKALVMMVAMIWQKNLDGRSVIRSHTPRRILMPRTHFPYLGPGASIPMGHVPPIFMKGETSMEMFPEYFRSDIIF